MTSSADIVQRGRGRPTTALSPKYGPLLPVYTQRPQTVLMAKSWFIYTLGRICAHQRRDANNRIAFAIRYNSRNRNRGFARRPAALRVNFGSVSGGALPPSTPIEASPVTRSGRLTPSNWLTPWMEMHIISNKTQPGFLSILAQNPHGFNPKEGEIS
jgi:hypothetical protein